VGVARESGRRELPLSTAPQHREIFGRVVDREHMLAVFRRELSALADGEIRVTRCKAKASKSRKSIRQGRLDVVYSVDVELGGTLREFTLLGITPVTPEFLRRELEERCPDLRDHPWAAPFRELATYVEELRLALLLFPLDPALPGLAEGTGSAAAPVLAALLPECRAGAEVVGVECDLVRYKPFDRAVVKFRATVRGPQTLVQRRTAYAKFFADDQGAAHFRNLTALWSVARDSTYLRMPEPLGYDAERRMLVMSEAPGERDLTRWIKCVERGDPLPAGVDPARLDRCARVVARALRELQASGVRPELQRTFRRELARVKADRDLLLAEVRKREPELTVRAEALIERLEALAPAEERLAPAHGCYRHKQMIGDEHSLTFIDWDGFSLANPVMDAATFLGRLCREPRRYPGSTALLEQMGATFRRAFLEDQPELARDLALYEGLVLTEQMLRAFRRPGDGAETAREVRCLAAAAAEMLDRVEGKPARS
jgi:aminoglycoside phosphotransferase (APT) family kinase protein